MCKYRYTYEGSDLKIGNGYINQVEIVVYADAEKNALSKAQEIIKKDKYSLVMIEEVI